MPCYCSMGIESRIFAIVYDRVQILRIGTADGSFQRPEEVTLVRTSTLVFVRNRHENSFHKSYLLSLM
jgi:hypothetical protein